MSNPERLEEFKLKVETFNSVKTKFIGSTSVNNIIRFLKKQDTPLSWLFVHALEAEVNNIEAKRQLLSGNKRLLSHSIVISIFISMHSSSESLTGMTFIKIT
jgi:hypothetical protein